MIKDFWGAKYTIPYDPANIVPPPDIREYGLPPNDLKFWNEICECIGT